MTKRKRRHPTDQMEARRKRTGHSEAAAAAKLTSNAQQMLGAKNVSQRKKFQQTMKMQILKAHAHQRNNENDLSKRLESHDGRQRPPSHNNKCRPKIKSPTMIMLLALASSLLASNCIYCQQSEMMSPAEARAAADLPAQRQANTFDQLVNLLSLYSSQQQAPALNFLNQNGNSNNNLRRAQAQGQPQQQQQQVSTPVNPFLVPAFQPTRRQQQPNLNQQNANNDLLLVASSSPPTPHLTLNRLASFVNQQQQQQQQLQGNRNSAQFNSFALPANRPNNNNRPPMQRIPQQQRPQFGQPALAQQPQPQQQPQPAPTQSQPFRAPAVQMAAGQQPAMKPISGFAPSGPPPSSGLNNAMVVVQSPPNASGQPAGDSSSAPPPASKSTEPPAPEESTSAASSTAATTAGGGSTLSAGESQASATTTNEPNLIAAATTTQSDQAKNNADSSWSPVQANSSSSTSGNSSLAETSAAPDQQSTRKASLAPSSDIITVPPDFNPEATSPNQAQSYDISVSAQMGGTQPLMRVGGSSSSSLSPQPPSRQPASSGELEVAGTNLSEIVREPSAIAPTAVTTIIWSPPAASEPQSSSPLSASIQPSRAFPKQQQHQQSASTKPATTSMPTTTTPTTTTTTAASRIRDNSLLEEPSNNGAEQRPVSEPAVVYGKTQASDSKPSAPSGGVVSPTSATAAAAGNRAAAIESSVAGRPFIQSVQIDNQVRPYSGAPPPPSAPKSGHGQPGPFKPSKPFGKSGAGPMSVGSGFTIVASGNQTMPSGDIQDYVAGQPPLLVPQLQQQQPGNAEGAANEPLISAQGGPDPALNSSAAAPSQPQPPTRIRRPTFRPKPRDHVQIDSCLPGDASSCDQSHNEHCHRELGISACHCRPGFARLSQLRGYCAPVSSFQLSFKIDRLADERPLAFNASLQDSNQVEYQYLEFETLQALAGALQQTSLAKQFMGAKVNKFFERRGKVWANVSLSLEGGQAASAGGNRSAASERLQFVANQELAKLAQQLRNRPLGDSSIVLDGARESVAKLQDIDECASRELNDCARNGSVCHNEIGGFHCQCLPGYQDPHLNEPDRSRHGRTCLGCPASYCSNRGECLVQPDGQRQCRCRANFMGARCDIDSEVLAVAVGGSLVGVAILLITFWCLFVFNRRWKREQQKLDAMSATSGLTFNYVNSAAATMLGQQQQQQSAGLHRSAGHQVGHYVGQRLGKASSYDQQAIIGSSASSGASSSASAAAAAAAAAAMGCHPYGPVAMAYAAGQPALAPLAHYDDSGQLLIGPGSSSAGSSEQTSPSASSYRAIMAGNSYTLSGHHHHHQPPHHAHSHHNHSHHHHQQQRAAALSQFNPAADYNPPAEAAGRWRTMQPAGGYYLSADMLAGYQQQQLYASPQRELCIDTGQSRKQRGRRAS